MAVVHLDSDPGAQEKLTEGLRFIRWFRQTFVGEGQTAPPFYEGLLSDAICAAWNAPALKVKMLALYFHHDGPESSEFARHLLDDTVSSIITEHCVLWGWDVGSPHNWHVIVEIVFENFGNAIGEAFGEMSEEDFPCLLLLSRGKEGIDFIKYVRSTPNKFNTVKTLVHAENLFSKFLRPALAHKENSKKQKSLFCGGGWAKVTEAMAIDANMAAYRINSEDPKTKSEGISQDIDLGAILSIRQVNSSAGSSRSSPKSTPPDGKTSKDRLKVVEKLMLESLTTRSMKLLDTQASHLLEQLNTISQKN